MLLLLYMLRNTDYFKYLVFLILVIIVIKLSITSTKENFESFKSKTEKYAYCDTIEEVSSFCKKNKSKLCKEYTKSLNNTKETLNKILLRMEKTKSKKT